MSNSTKVTVIVPVYNQEKLITKALESIPLRKDIEIIVIDDGSTDKTWDSMMRFRNEHEEFINLVLLYNEDNKGVSYTINCGLDIAKGEYVVLLGSDDYFLTKRFEEIVDNYLTGKDLVYFNLEINDKTIWQVNEKTSRDPFVGSVKFMKREFIGDTRNPVDKRATEDWFFYQDLLKKNPTEYFTGITAKHYNFPREGSLSNLSSKGQL